MGPRSHLHRRLGFQPGATVPPVSSFRFQPGTTVPPVSSFRFSAWDHGPTCIVVQASSLGPRSHLHRRSGFQPGTTVPPASSFRFQPGTTVPPASSFRFSAWDHGPTCIVVQASSLGPRSHLHRRSGFQPGTTVPPASSFRFSAWDHGPTCIVV